ncbi:DUF3261 domain-containing protein [Colwellia piezophila]|uniref:DUF3261 domain-containing protein n=1 Tax=Colwellia piezophila TaxID=211668 RepID=UPI00037AEF1B|nr:DUF3261 domain-containing protein [Colwellia piezophila]
MSVKLFIAVWVLILSGCSATSNVSLNQIDIAQGVTLQLTAPDSTLVNHSKQQLLTITHNGNVNQLLTRLELTEKGLNLVAVSPQGLPLFSLVFVEGQALQQKKYVEVDMLPLAYIISDIQLVYWPVKQLNEAIIGAKIVEHHEGKERVIESKGKVVIRINKGSDNISFRHLQRGYQLTISPVE